MIRRFCCLFSVVVGLAGSVPLRAAPSALWGTDGVNWTPASRLPDFSFAGYQSGATAIPNVAVATDVKKFGAIGDGKSDDTEAFRRALKATPRGAILIPAGRYVLTDILTIDRSQLVLRGAGPGQTVLVIPRSLEQVFGAKEAPEGKKSSWSFGGAFLEVRGRDLGKKISVVAKAATRGERTLEITDLGGVKAGDWVRVLMNDDPALGRHLHAGLVDAAETTRKEMKHFYDSVVRVVAIRGRTLTLDRPLRLDVRPEWQAEIWSWKPTVSEVGLESLSFKFAGVPKKHHLQEEGFNAIHLRGAANCWVRDVEVIDADNGVVVGERSRFCTVENFRARAAQRSSPETGHHALWVTGASQDCLFSGFAIETPFHHDLSVEGCASGNVFERGSAVKLCLDHHSNAPFENLFTEIDAGDPRRLWLCGGREDRGAHTAARTTLWNLRYREGTKPPPVPIDWPQINVIGLRGYEASTTPAREWIEPCDGDVTPSNLFRAQQTLRLQKAETKKSTR